MFDYTHVMTARKEYEDRNHMRQDGPDVRFSLTGPLRRVVAGIGTLLVRIGGRLQARAGAPEQPPAGALDSI